MINHLRLGWGFKMGTGSYFFFKLFSLRAFSSPWPPRQNLFPMTSNPQHRAGRGGDPTCWQPSTRTKTSPRFHGWRRRSAWLLETGLKNDPRKKKKQAFFLRFSSNITSRTFHKFTSRANESRPILTGAIRGVAVGEQRRRLLLLAGCAQLVEVDRQLPDGDQGSFLLGAQVQHLLHVLHWAGGGASKQISVNQWRGLYVITQVKAPA